MSLAWKNNIRLDHDRTGAAAQAGHDIHRASLMQFWGNFQQEMKAGGSQPKDLRMAYSLLPTRMTKHHEHFHGFLRGVNTDAQLRSNDIFLNATIVTSSPRRSGHHIKFYD